MPAPETLRQDVAKHTTVSRSVVAMLDGIAAATAEDGAQAWAKAYTSDPRAWADAVLANTPHAIETTERDAPAPPVAAHSTPQRPHSAPQQPHSAGHGPGTHR